ncbi:hypothetical protein SLA2020_201470 [Shorea laevis]
MDSGCFEEYTFTSYTCPICYKSLGDMQLYFRTLDALWAEERMPDEYCGQTQAILCNDCQRKGTAPFRWHIPNARTVAHITPGLYNSYCSMVSLDVISLSR